MERMRTEDVLNKLNPKRKIALKVQSRRIRAEEKILRENGFDPGEIEWNKAQKILRESKEK